MHVQIVHSPASSIGALSGTSPNERNSDRVGIMAGRDSMVGICEAVIFEVCILVWRL